MARSILGAGNSNYLSIAASTDFDFNDGVCLMAIIKQNNVPTASNIDAIIHFGTGSGGYGMAVNAHSSGRLEFTKIGVATRVASATTAAIQDEWIAVYGHSGTGILYTFKRYRYSDDTLATEVNGNTDSMIAPTNDPAIIGQWISPANNFGLDGSMMAVAMLRAKPTNGEFVQWALTGKMPQHDFLVHHWFIGDSPEFDRSGKGHAAIINGTAAVVGGGPVPLPWTQDIGWVEPTVVVAPGGLSIPVAAYHYNHHLAA